MTKLHLPVLLQETLAVLDQKPGAVVIDGTVGDGGHLEALLTQLDGKARALGIDLDQKALKTAKKRLLPFKNAVALVQGSFRDMESLARENGFENITGILLDLGIRSAEIEESGLGFSFLRDEPLIMRFDGKTEEETAASIVNGADREELVQILRVYGEERYARQIASAIVTARKRTRITRTLELVDIIRAAVPGSARRQKIHVATRTFQALRIAVNDELGALKETLPTAVRLLQPGGTLAVISFHSLEDRIVKNAFRQFVKEDLGSATRKPFSASEEEVSANPRARSAHLRGFQKKV